MAVPRHSDRDLAARIRKGDTGAFERLVERHQRLVFGVAYAITGDRALAEDLGQETFVTAWRSFHTLHDDARVAAWLTGIARNLAHNAVRTRARRKDPGELVESDAVDPAPTPLDLVIEEESEVLLRRTLQELSEQHREVMVLYYIEGRSVGHVAAGLGVSEDAVKQRLSRARDSLRERLAERLEEKLQGMRPRRSFAPEVLAIIGGGAGAGGAAAGSGAGGAGTAYGTGVVMTTKKLLLLGSALAVAGGAVAIGLTVGSGARVTTPHAPSEKAAAKPADGPGGEAAVPAPVKPTPGKLTARKLAAGEREQLHRAIVARRQQRSAAAPSARAEMTRTLGPGESASEEEDRDKVYVREAVRAILPMITECYDEVLARLPELEGDVMMNFTIEGELDVGGLIGSSEVDAEGTTIDDADFRECMRETMYAIEIDPPTGGGIVQVKYPFSFRPAPPAP